MQGEAPHSTVFGYCDGTGTQWGCPRGTRAFTLVEFDLSSLNKDAEVCMASLSMVQTDHTVNAVRRKHPANSCCSGARGSFSTVTWPRNG